MDAHPLLFPVKGKLESPLALRERGGGEGRTPISSSPEIKNRSR
jgi:hypothetical protein